MQDDWQEDGEENLNWQDFIKDVRPLKKAEKVALSRAKKTAKDNTDFSQAREKATVFAHKDNNPLSLEIHEWVDPYDVIGYKQSGIQEGVYRKLRLGKYPVQAQLDLHRKTMKEARQLLFDFITRSYNNGWRTVMVLHGKGGVNGKKAQMKSFCAQWLKEMDTVVAYHSAQPQTGGAGALYVLVRKNPQRKTETAQQFNR